MLEKPPPVVQVVSDHVHVLLPGPPTEGQPGAEDGGGEEEQVHEHLHLGPGWGCRLPA